ncbi:MAG TPA: DUF4912 domain-containing protein [Verrucomicrobiae bacterium]
MKKDSGKKPTKSKIASSRAPASKKEPKLAKSSQAEQREERSATTTPFAPAAASPLSKEEPDPPKAKDKTRREVSKVAASDPLPYTASAPQPQPPATEATRPINAPSSTTLALPTDSTSSSLQVTDQEEKRAAKTTPAPAKAKPGKRPDRVADRRPEVKVPSLLLEGDLPPGPPISGPGARYALAPQPVTPPPLTNVGELPEAYGTGRVFLAARDPHWVYVSWDLTAEQQNRHNAQSRDGHLIVKIYARDDSMPAVPEVHVHPESKNWFVHVPHAETPYRAEIGYYDAKAAWRSVAVSQHTLTPPDAPSNDVSAKFATIPAEVTFQQVVEAVQQFVTISKSEPLLEAVAQAAEAQREHRPPITTDREPNLPRTSVTPIGHVPDPRTGKTRRRPPESLPVEITSGGEWSAEQTRALTKLIHIDSFRRVWLGSMEITELVRLQLQEEMASIAAAEAKRAIRGEKVPTGPFELNITSPSGGEFRKPGKFWFKVNAELIIYGATEPDATVTIADRQIKLRPDGTFSFRFSLPDGRYELPAVAISSDGEEGREARLEFSRSTDYRGHVEPHAQDPALQPPHRENVS